MGRCIYFTLALAALIISAFAGIALYSNDEFRLFPKGDQPGVLDVMTRAMSSSQVSQEFDTYHSLQEDHAQPSQSMVNSYYNLATDFYEYGWGTSFHFAHTLAHESHDESILRHEYRIADTLGLKPGHKVLDAGCGVGGPARNIAAYSGANVVGVTLNEYQVGRAKYHTRKAKLDHLVDFVQGDFTKMDFADATFDAAYAIEATVHATNLTEVYAEIFRVLKPGGKFFAYEWLVTPKYDSSDEEEAKIVREIEYGDGLPPLRDIHQVIQAAKDSGFQLLQEVDLAEDKNGTKPWYHRLDMGTLSHYATHFTCLITETLGLAPKGTLDVHGMLLKAAFGLVKGGKREIFTPMHVVVLAKPM